MLYAVLMLGVLLALIGFARGQAWAVFDHLDREAVAERLAARRSSNR